MICILVCRMSAHCEAEEPGKGALPAQALRVHGRPHLALQVEGHDAVRDGPFVEAGWNVAAAETGHNLSLRHVVTVRMPRVSTRVRPTSLCTLLPQTLAR